jgi:hypothetical protein
MFTFDVLIAMIDKDYSGNWRPSDDRIIVEELEEDEIVEPSLENIKLLVPKILNHLNSMQAVIPEQMGHNAPPELYTFTIDEIQTLRSQLDQISEIPPGFDLKDASFLRDAADQALRLSAGCLRYAASKGDIFVTNFAENAGAVGGKWTARALMIYLAGTGLKEFAELILQAIS